MAFCPYSASMLPFTLFVRFTILGGVSALKLPADVLPLSPWSHLSF